MGLDAFSYIDDLEKAKTLNFNKKLFILNNSDIISNKIEFDITGNLLQSNYDFNYDIIPLKFYTYINMFSLIIIIDRIIII